MAVKSFIVQAPVQLQRQGGNRKNKMPSWSSCPKGYGIGRTDFIPIQLIQFPIPNKHPLWWSKYQWHWHPEGDLTRGGGWVSIQLSTNSSAVGRMLNSWTQERGFKSCFRHQERDIGKRGKLVFYSTLMVKMLVECSTHEPKSEDSNLASGTRKEILAKGVSWYSIVHWWWKYW